MIEIDTRARQTFSLNDPPYGVAFGVDGRALVVTATQFLLFDPLLGTMTVLDTISGVTARTLPQPPDSFPTQIVGASVQASGDLLKIHGLTDTIMFTYDVGTRTVDNSYYVAEPALGPRAVSVSRDGSYYMAGWAMFDARSALHQFPSPMGLLYVGSHAIDSDRGVMYAEVPMSTTTTTTTSGSASGSGTTATIPDPVLMVNDAENLTVLERLRLPEHLAGKGVLSADGSTMYALSESGIMILPVGNRNTLSRVQSSVEDLLFRGSACNPGVVSQQIEITDPGGGNTEFALSTSTSGIRISPAAGVTPAVVTVSVDPSVFQNVQGTTVASIDLASPTAVNIAPSIRVLINLQSPEQRGTIVNVPGKLVDLLPDPYLNRFFVLRQDRNQVLVYDGSTYQLTATLKTGNTPTSMAISFDRKYLLVGNDNSQLANVYDLQTLTQQAPIRAPFGHYPRWIASSANATLTANRVAGPAHTIDRVDFGTRSARQLPTLGVYQNTIHLNTALVATPNGSSIMAAEADGNVMLYNANVDSFTISRKFATVQTGAVAASNFDQFVIGNSLLNASLVQIRQFDSVIGKSSGFAFYDMAGYRSGAATASSPGVMERVSTSSSTIVKPTRMAEAPVLGNDLALFTRTIAILPDRSAVVNLTTSGFTVMAWNYDTAVAVPMIDRVVNAADGTAALAPGGLIVVQGRNLSPVNVATQQVPLPSALGDSCLAVNGMGVPMIMASPTQINAQLPFQAEGNITMTLKTPGGVSDDFILTVLPTAPSIFRTAIDESYSVPSVVRASNEQLVTASNPIRNNDELWIYLTGMGVTNPEIPAGTAAPSSAPTVLTQPQVDINGYPLTVLSAGLTPGQVGVYTIRVKVPYKVPKGMNESLRVTQGGYSTAVSVRVID